MDISTLNLAPEVEAFINTQKDFIIDRISREGGNCDIFFGNHKILKRRIALKIYDAQEKSSSHNEPHILSTLDHTNILKVRDAKQISPYHSYFMTDEIDGGDLEKYFKAGKLDLKKALNIIHGILCGLNELHKEGIQIVHRDIKPKNILIRESDSHPLIADFGSIKQFDSTSTIGGSRTTTLYKPNEVIEGGNYTIQSDIYQVGVTMFQILGGDFPDRYIDWLSTSEKKKLAQITGSYDQSIFIDQAIYKKISKGELLNIDSLPPYIKKDIKKIIQKATHLNLKIRYSTASEFMSDLLKVQRTLTNWSYDGTSYYATTSKGEEFRINSSNKGFYTEKNGKSGWRKTGDWSKEIQTQIAKCN